MPGATPGTLSPRHNDRGFFWLYSPKQPTDQQNHGLQAIRRQENRQEEKQPGPLWRRNEEEIRAQEVMPYKVAKRGNKYRVLDQNGRIAKNKGGTAMDGGGHSSEAKAKRQVNAVSMSERGVKPKRGK